MYFTKTGYSNYLHRGKRLPVRYVRKEGMTFQEAEKLAQDILDRHSINHKGKAWVSLKYNVNWMSQRDGATTLGDKVHLWNWEEYDDEKKVNYQQDTFDELYFVFQYTKKRSGGATDENNDCLFDCLVRLTNGAERMKPLVNTPESLKKYLGIERKAKVSIDCMPKIENVYRLNINVSGDHIYQSPKKYGGPVHEIKLINGHFSVPFEKEKERQLEQGYEYKQKIVEVYYNDAKCVKVYSKGKIVRMSQLEFVDYKIAKRDKCIFVESDDGNVKLTAERYIEDAKTLINETNGEINLFKSAFAQGHAKRLFCRRSYGTPLPDPISQLEDHFLVSKGALIKAVPGEYENVHEYDVNSMYPYITTAIMIPIKKGETAELSDLPEKLEYGIYHCKIHEPNEKQQLVFRTNSECMYTHYDIQGARLLGLKVELINDGQANALIYTREKLISGKRLFGPTVNYLFGLRKMKLNNAGLMKHILNSLWGSLCEVKNKAHTTKPGEVVEIPDEAEISSIVPFGKGERVKYYFPDRKFKTNYARIGPFITSFGRFFMLRTALPHLDNVIRIHTDSILSTKEIPELKVGLDLGQWKYYSHSKAVIKNSNNRPNFT